MKISDENCKKLGTRFGKKYRQWRFRFSHILELPISYVNSDHGRAWLPKLFYMTFVANIHNELVTKNGRDCGNSSMNRQCIGALKTVIDITDWSIEEKCLAKKYLDEKLDNYRLSSPC